MKTIVITDDDEQTLFTLSTVMKKAGFACITTKNSTECLKSLKDNNPDLLLLDVVLPDIPGTDLCLQIKKDPQLKHIPIILISGQLINSDDHAFGLEIGADDYISRPIENRQLIARINAILRLKETIIKARDKEPFTSFDQSNTEQTAKIFKQQSLKDAYPDVFKKNVESYIGIIDNTIEQRIYKTEENTTNNTKLFAEELGFLNAGARDIIDIHKEALKKLLPINSAKRTFYIKEESRILLVECMGFLLNYYQTKQ